MATKRISALTAAGSAALTDQIPIEDATNATKRLTLTQVFALAASSPWSWAGTHAFGAAVTMATTLGVTGAVTLASTLSAQATTLASLSVTGDAGVGGNFAVNTNKFNVTAASGNTAIAGTLAVAGASTLTGALALAGDFALATNKVTMAAATGNTVIAGTLGAGASTLASLAVTGAAIVGTTFGVTGASTLSSTLAVTGAATLASTLAVTGVATFSTAPNLTGTSSYQIGGQPTFTNTSGLRQSASFASVGNPAASSSAAYIGATGFAATDAACAQNLTGIAGLRGLFARVRHQGTGTVTGGVAILVETPTVDNTAGGGLMTNAYAVYISAQAATGITNPWGVYQLGATTKNLFAGPIVLGSTAGPTIESGSGSPEGVKTAEVSSIYLRTNGSAGSLLYQKQTGSGNTGWLAIA